MKILPTLIRVEMLKVVVRPAFWVTWGMFFVLNVDNSRNANQVLDSALGVPSGWPSSLLLLSEVGAFIVPMLVILLCTPEFTWRTSRQNVMDGLSRGQYFSGKLVMLAGLVMLYLATAIVAGTGGALLSPGEMAFRYPSSADLRFIGGLALGLTLLGSLSVMLSTMIRAAGPTFGLFFLYVVLELVLLGPLLPENEFIQSVITYLPVNVAQGLGNPLTYYQADILTAIGVFSGTTGLNLLEPRVLVVTGLVSSGVFLIGAYFNVRYRDL